MSTYKDTIEADIEINLLGGIMNKFFILFLSTLYLISSSTFAFNVTDFENEISNAEEKYINFTSKEETKRLFAQGRVSETTRLLKNIVPDNKKTFYDYFILGNMFFVMDRITSYQYMIQAENLDSDNPYMLFERGIHEHRKGNYAAAVKYYERFYKTSAGASNPVVSAYLTHVYLMTGDTSKAFKYWKKAKFGRNHTQIEKGMYTIFSDTNQEFVRENLIKKINAGDTSKLCDLYEQDSNWEIDWWNNKPKQAYLEFDLMLSKKLLVKDSQNEKFFRFCSSDKKLSNKDYVQRLNELGVLAGKKKLPESSSLTYNILKRLISSKLITAQEFLDEFEHQIKKSSSRNPNDKKYYDILAYLYANTDNHDKLKYIDLKGWKELNLENYASSYVAGINQKSEHFRKYLDKGLYDFPLSVTLNKINLSIQKDKKRDAYIRFVASQFANVKNNWASRYRLNDYVASLSHELNKLKE